jgi:formate hydrogenlyase subunit 4
MITSALIQTLLVLVIAPAVVGMIRTCKARLQNRRGASPLLPYLGLVSLLKKEMTVPKQSSWVYHAVPFAVLTLTVLLAFLIPTGFGGTLGLNSIFLVSGLLALSSAFLVFGGMDTGSTFGNMGSSREMTLAALVEPALVTSFVTLGLVAGVWHLDGIVSFFYTAPWYTSAPYLLVTFVGLLFVVLSENARYPVDNPATHLELTMVHEAMLLEYSGPYLAMLEYASYIKLTVLGVFLAYLIAPVGGWWMVVVYALAVSVSVALIETLIVKMRFYRMQEYMTMACLISVCGLLIACVSIV